MVAGIPIEGPFKVEDSKMCFCRPIDDSHDEIINEFLGDREESSSVVEVNLIGFDHILVWPLYILHIENQLTKMELGDVPILVKVNIDGVLLGG